MKRNKVVPVKKIQGREFIFNAEFTAVPELLCLKKSKLILDMVKLGTKNFMWQQERVVMSQSK